MCDDNENLNAKKKLKIGYFSSKLGKRHLNSTGNGAKFRPLRTHKKHLQPIVTFQDLISTEFLQNFPILSFLLLFRVGLLNNGGQTFIGNLLQPVISPFKNLSQQNFSIILGFLVFCSCSSLGIQIMVDRLSSVICYSQL